MLDNLLSSLIHLFHLMKINAVTALIAVGVLWAIHIINCMMRYRLNSLGLFPRRIRGIPGIIFSPFFHGSFTHLFLNSIPLFVLLDFILMGGMHSAILVTLLITVISGILLWLFGRNGNHIGASGLIMGYLSYLLINAYEHPSIKTVVLGIICAYYFGGLIFSIFPKEERTSWEGHLFGFIAGISVVFLGFLAK
jgi:membrane associated rhomboid family serine protease